MFAAIWTEKVHIVDPRAATREMRHGAIGQECKVRQVANRAQQRYPGVRLETHGIAVAVDIGSLCAVGWLRPLTPTWRMISRDNRKWSAVIGHSEGRHAGYDMRADWVKGERLLVLVTA